MNIASDGTNSSTTHTTTHFGLITQFAASGFISLYANAERDGNVDFYGNGENATHSNMFLTPHLVSSKKAKGGYTTTTFAFHPYFASLL